MSRKRRQEQEERRALQRKNRLIAGVVSGAIALGAAAYFLARGSNCSEGSKSKSDQAASSPLPVKPLPPTPEGYVYASAPEWFVTQTAVSSQFGEWQDSGSLHLEFQSSLSDYTLRVWSLRRDSRDGSRDVTLFLQRTGLDFPRFLDDLVDVIDTVIPTTLETLDSPVRELDYVLVDDPTIPDGQNCSALSGTNATALYIRPWVTKMYRNRAPDTLLYLSMAHELYHTINYATDADEGKILKEFSAMTWEASLMIQLRGVDRLWHDFGAFEVSEIAKDPALRRFDFTKHVPNFRFYLRALAWFTTGMIYDQYGIEKTKEVSRELLHDPSNWVESYDGTMKRLGVTYKGVPLTVEYASRELNRFIARVAPRN